MTSKNKKKRGFGVFIAAFEQVFIEKRVFQNLNNLNQSNNIVILTPQKNVPIEILLYPFFVFILLHVPLKDF